MYSRTSRFQKNKENSAAVWQIFQWSSDVPSQSLTSRSLATVALTACLFYQYQQSIFASMDFGLCFRSWPAKFVNCHNSTTKMLGVPARGCRANRLMSCFRLSSAAKIEQKTSTSPKIRSQASPDLLASHNAVMYQHSLNRPFSSSPPPAGTWYYLLSQTYSSQHILMLSLSPRYRQRTGRSCGWLLGRWKRRCRSIWTQQARGM